MPARTLRLDAHGPGIAFLRGDEEPRGDERLLRVHGAVEAVALLDRISPAEGAREVLRALMEPELGFAAGRMADRELRAAAASRMVDGSFRMVELRGGPTLSRGGQSFRVLAGSVRPRRGESVLAFYDREGALRFLRAMWDDVWSRRAVEAAAYRGTGRARGEPVHEVLERFADRIATRRVQVVRLCATGVPAGAGIG